MLALKTSVLEPTAESTEIPSTASPASSSSSRLFIRASTGLGRLLRGTAQAVLREFWMAWPSPEAPNSAARVPTTTTVVEPCMPSGRPSWSPMIGNCARAELSTWSWSSGRSCRMKPRIEEASSSSGKIAMKA